MRSAVSSAFEPGKLKHRQSHRRLAVQVAACVLIAGTQFDPGDVFQVRDFALVARLDDDVGELLRLGQAAQRGHRVLKIDACRHGRLAELAGRNLHVLLAQGGDDVALPSDSRADSRFGSSQTRML